MLPRSTLLALSAFALSTAVSFNVSLRSLLATTDTATPTRLHATNDQLPMNPGPVLPSMPAPESDEAADRDSSLRISDVLPKTRSINIFAALTRDISSISGRLESSTDNTTLLAPLNSAMQELPRKPWEDRPGDDTTVSAANNEEKAAKNLERFVNEHVIPVSPWRAGKENKIKTVGGQELWWEERNGKKVVLPGELVVSSVVGRVGNGEVWAIKGVVNYA